MAAPEMELIAAMLATGDLSPIHDGRFTAEHCQTNEGKSIHNFLASYRETTHGAGRVPTRNIILERFDQIAEDLPESHPNVDLGALLHEVHLSTLRARLSELAVEASEIASSVDPLSELKFLRAMLDKAMMEVSSETVYGFAENLDDIFDDYHTGNILPDGIPYPQNWGSLQDATKGMQKGEFIIVAGRPKTRKTFVALYICTMAFLQGYRVLVFTPEMHPKQILLRAAAMAAFLRYSPFKRGELKWEEEEALLEIVEKYGNPKMKQMRDAEYGSTRKFDGSIFKVFKATNKTVSYIEQKIEEFKPHLVFVDSFYRLSAEGSRKSDSDHKVLTGISRDIKDCAAQHEVVMLGTHQINRDGSKKVGDLDNLAYADAFGQDADLVLRIITNKRENEPDLSAVVVLGAREVPFDGILIHNEPCNDFGEVGVITNTKKVMQMLRQEEEEQDGDDGEGKPAPKAENTLRRIANNKRGKKKPKAPSKGFVTPRE